MADSYEIRVTVTAGEGLAADEVVTIRNADRLTPADLFDQVGRGILAARHVIAGWQADAAECDGCGGTAEPLNENGMCPSCVRPDAEVDAQPPAQRLGQAVPTHTAELRRMADAVAQVWRPGG